MQLVMEKINGVFLRDILDKCEDETEWIKAAVAYATYEGFFKFCIEKNIKLDFYCRLDPTIPVKIDILKKFVRSTNPNYRCYLIKGNRYHPKVIWWYNYGVYIGSANLTDSAWSGNIEFGVFFNQSDILTFDIEHELNRFFDEIQEIATPLTEEDIQNLEKIEKKYSFNADSDLRRGEADRYNLFNDLFRNIKSFQGLADINPKVREQKEKEKFCTELRETIQILRNIGQIIIDQNYIPSWIKGSPPIGIQVDRFLFAYYDNLVWNGHRYDYEGFYQKNKDDPNKALLNALNWWKNLKEPPKWVDFVINEWAPFLFDKFSSKNIQHLSENDLSEICFRVHSIRDHARRVENIELGLNPNETMDEDTRSRLFGAWLFKQRSLEGKSILELLSYVLYGSGKIEDRVWVAISSTKWRIRHLGLSSINEIIGWALPDKYPLRNNRTNKSLGALGYDVKLW